MKRNIRAAAVQAEPVWFDAAGTVEKTITLIEEAARNGAEIVAFPEVWIPGYPAFLMYATIDGEMPFVAEYRESSIAADGPEMALIQKAAEENNIMVGLGFSERGGRSLYMSQALISNTGEPLILRRKLKPTHRERALYGQGDGSDLQVVDSHLGKISALMCWEHLQPFNKMAMLSKGAQIHIASWPQLDFFGGATMTTESIHAVNRSYALECGAFNLMSTQILSQAGQAALNRHGLEIPDFVGGGGAAIFGPDASQLTQPLQPTEEGIVYADLDMQVIELANYLTDPAGHYSRPDVYNLSINTTKRGAFNLHQDSSTFPAEVDEAEEIAFVNEE
ncbi:carbon-nitrogen hydrolase family protein [Glutamicibacter creatinolyticus]|uniref:carbon-nitrogen hydrolase family protein n=1 Tax=Glutamicibacter creatinolyticus TaxID=162496 RepID=UPI0037BE44C6